MPGRKPYSMIHDLPAGDGTGRTIREANLARKHRIPIGSLVELDNGCRLFVVKHERDCDGAPLYTLAPDKPAQLYEYLRGYSEELLKVVRPFENDKTE